jgi:hypothetical protein
MSRSLSRAGEQSSRLVFPRGEEESEDWRKTSRP